MFEVSTILVLLVATYAAIRAVVQTVDVREYQALLVYKYGRFTERLGPGRHIMLRHGTSTTFIDMREKTVTIAGQEVLSRDNVGIKVSLTMTYAVTMPEQALHLVESYVDALYAAAQLELRTLIAGAAIEELLGQRLDVAIDLLARIATRVEGIGLSVRSVAIKDVMFPGELKKIFNEVVRAKKEGEASLERTRSETATLRSLANTAKLLGDHPGLFELRSLQAMTNAAPGTTLVWGVPQGIVPKAR